MRKTCGYPSLLTALLTEALPFSLFRRKEIFIEHDADFMFGSRKKNTSSLHARVHTSAAAIELCNEEGRNLAHRAAAALKIAFSFAPGFKRFTFPALCGMSGVWRTIEASAVLASGGGISFSAVHIRALNSIRCPGGELGHELMMSLTPNISSIRPWFTTNIYH